MGSQRIKCDWATEQKCPFNNLNSIVSLSVFHFLFYLSRLLVLAGYISCLVSKSTLVFASLLFPSISLLCSLRKNFFISSCYSLELCIQMGIFSLFSIAFWFSSQLKDLLRQPFCLCVCVCVWMVLITASCTMLQTSIHSSSDTLSDLIPWIHLSPPLYNHKGFDLYHTWTV